MNVVGRSILKIQKEFQWKQDEFPMYFWNVASIVQGQDDVLVTHVPDGDRIYQRGFIQYIKQWLYLYIINLFSFYNHFLFNWSLYGTALIDLIYHSISTPTWAWFYCRGTNVTTIESSQCDLKNTLVWVLVPNQVIHINTCYHLCIPGKCFVGVYLLVTSLYQTTSKTLLNMVLFMEYMHDVIKYAKNFFRISAMTYLYI